MALSNYILPPDPIHLRLIGPLLVSAEFIFVVFLGITFVSTVASLICWRSRPSLARDLALVTGTHGGVWLMLGLLPLLTLSVLLAQLLHGSQFAVFDSLAMLFPLAGLALIAMWNYRRNLTPFFGIVGVLATLAFVLPFIGLLEFIRRPEQWPLWNPLVPDIYNAMVLPWLGIFFAGALLATGAALLGIYFCWPERKLADDVPHRNALRIVAIGMLHVGALVLPALIVWDFALPAWGVQTVKTITHHAPLFVLLWLVALASGMMFLRGHAKWAGFWAVVALAALAWEVKRQHAMRMYAIQDKVALLRMAGEKRFAEFKLAQEARYPSNVPLDAAAAARIYDERCASCHAMDRKVVGPAHQDVLPKYKGQPDKLAGYILNPVKVDPAYPAMPALGLSRREAAAVADYLLNKMYPPATEAKP